MNQVGILGAGAWGTALAAVAARAGHEVVLWAREQQVIESINRDSMNSLFLPGIKLPKIRAVSDYNELRNCETIALVPPAQHVRAACLKLKEAGIKAPLIICSKGIEQETQKLMSEVVADLLPNPLAVLSGPTFADEIAKGLPGTASLACEDERLGQKLQAFFTAPPFSLSLNRDVIGTQISGSVKNVLAIGCGILAGLEAGVSAQAALLTAGWKETETLCVAKGGNKETLMEPCGIGDLMLTCLSPKSRNMSLGLALGKGASLADYTKDKSSVAEGVFSAESVTKLAASLQVKMPICEKIQAILLGAYSANSLRV